MIIYFDVMFLNDTSLLQNKQHERRNTLEVIVQQIPGHSALVEHYLLDFSKHAAIGDLREIFAKSIVRHEEGLVLKPANDPYFTFSKTGLYKSCCIKMKKEYIGVCNVTFR